MSVDIDKDGLETYSDEFENARSTSEVRRRMTESEIVRDDSDKCNVEAQFTSNGNTIIIIIFNRLLNIHIIHTLGNIEMFYEAKQDSDASTCAMKARMTADSINNLGRAGSNRRSRQTEEEGADPIFNLVTVATTMENSIPDDTGDGDGGGNGGGNGGAASVIAASCSLLFGLIMLTMLML